MKIIAQNKKARFNFEILKKLEAGIVLKGSEVKSIRQNNVNINDSFGKIIKGELFLINTHIASYKEGSYFNPDPTRSRKLLLHQEEIKKLLSKIKEKGFSLVPLSLYFNSQNKVKVEIALVQGKKLHDKRQTLKEKDLKQKALKEMKNFNA